MRHFNTLVRYTRIPQEDDFSMNEGECMLACTNPVISYDRGSHALHIQGPDVNLRVIAKNVSIEDKA